MSRFVAPLAGVLVLAFVASAEDKKDDKKTADKLVGTWKVTKTEDPLPEGATATVEFTKDGKLTIKLTGKDINFNIAGTYKVESEDKVKVTLKEGDKEMTETSTIKKLTDTELVISDEKGKTTEMKKEKEEKKDK